MSGRRNSDLAKIQARADTACPHCGTRIEPKDYERIDWEHLECPKCHRRFAPLERVRSQSVPAKPAVKSASSKHLQHTAIMNTI